MTASALSPVLVVIRGNSGSGKSTVARGVQARFESGECALIEQDYVRRTVLRESDVVGALNIDLIEQAASVCLQRGLVVIVEGIFHTTRYGPMLERLSHAATGASLFYAYDLTFAETWSRHATREKATTFGREQMMEWYHGWQALDFVSEMRIDSSWSESAAVDRMVIDIAAARVLSCR